MAILPAACTSGNIVTDFEQPTYTVIDTLVGGIEIRRYDARALAGEASAESAVTGSPARIDAAAAKSGLLAVQVEAGDEEGDGKSGLLTTLEASPKWQAIGDPIQVAGDSSWSLTGATADQLAAPVRRRDLIPERQQLPDVENQEVP